MTKLKRNEDLNEENSNIKIQNRPLAVILNLIQDLPKLITNADPLANGQHDGINAVLNFDI